MCWNINIGYLAVLLSLASGAGCLFVYVVHERKLKKQEKRLNKYYLEREERQETERKQADLVAEVVNGRTPHTYNIRIYNRGIARAGDIRFAFLDPSALRSVIVNRENLSCPYLDQGLSFDIPVTTFGNDAYCIKLIWNDEYGTDRSREQTIRF